MEEDESNHEGGGPLTDQEETPRLVTLGESMIRLSPPDDQRLQRTGRLSLRASGAESSVAVAADRLGVQAGWISKLPRSPLGRRVVDEMKHAGIQTEITWTDEGRQGVYFLEVGAPPRGVEVIYDRDNTAFSSITPADIDTDLIESAEVFFLSGITPALSETTAETASALLELAKEAGVTTAFDINYRSKLWDRKEAREQYQALFEHVDMLFGSLEDVKTVFDRPQGDIREVAHHFGSNYDFETVVLSRLGHQMVAWQGSSLHTQESLETATINPIGVGSAMIGGFLARQIEGGSIPSALEYGAAAGALKSTIQQDTPLITRKEVERLLEGEQARVRR